MCVFLSDKIIQPFQYGIVTLLTK